MKNFRIKLNVINAVIPAAFGPIRAKAGIHERKYWIPAVKVLWTFAGMTSVVGTQTIKLVYLK